MAISDIDAGRRGGSEVKARLHLAAERYRPIGDYAVIGDARTAALVSSAGAIDWMCLPSFSDDAVFAAILDADKGGRFSITPAEPFEAVRRYGVGSACLYTTFRSETAEARLTDLMVLPCEDRRCFEPQRELLRMLRCLRGRMAIEILYAPRPAFGLLERPVRNRDGLGWRCSWEGHLLTLLTDAELEATPSGCGAGAVITLEEGQSVTFSLTFSEHDPMVLAPLGEAAIARAGRTERWWREWSTTAVYDGPQAAMVARSAVTLKMMTYGLSGAVVAAPTTSLPETLGGMRNWDYRYCWLRDASLTMHAFLGLGHRMEGAAFFDWLLHTTRLTRPELAVMYDVFGRPELPERELEHLEGYHGSKPVRAGNAAAKQTQLDIFGTVILAAYEFCRRGGPLDEHDAGLLGDLGRAICRNWRRPGHGIWEIRAPLRLYTYGRITAWAGLDRLIRLAEERGMKMPIERFRETRNAIRRAIESEAIDPATGALMGAFGDPTPDAALLLTARYGFYEATHPVMKATEALIAERLTDGPFVYRYPQTWDGMAGEEAAFGICSFWRVDYLARAGRVEEAAELFDALCGYANDVGLFAEEIEPRTGAHLGNFPQAFTHVGLINAALALQEALAVGRARAPEEA